MKDRLSNVILSKHFLKHFTERMKKHFLTSNNGFEFWKRMAGQDGELKELNYKDKALKWTS